MTPPTLFTHGYALLIGVDDSQVARLRLPDVAKDVKALAEVLSHPDRCAYPADNIKVISGSAATRAGILAGLTWLRERISADSDATAVLFYSGHGHRDDSAGEPVYALVPYDVDDQQIELSALAASDFARAVEALRPKRLLVVLDCCHAGGMGAKDLDNALTALPAKLFATSAAKGIDVAKSIDSAALQQGQGRAVLSSSQGSERSYMRIDGAMSLFTYHLIEALTGHAQPAGGAPDVLVSDVLSHVSRQVPAAASAMDRDQHPDALIQGNFPIALVLGGKGLAKGTAAPDPLAPISAPPAAMQTTNTGSGAVAQGPGAIAAGERGVAFGGSADGATIITGDGNRVEKVDTGGSAYIRGNVTVGRDFVGRDKVVQGDDVAGDKVQGDKVVGDKINVGDISGSSGIAIGRGAQAHVTTITHGLTGDDLDKLFIPLLTVVQQAEAAKREQALQQVNDLKNEVSKGKEANDGRLAGILEGLVALVPSAVTAVVSAFANPILAGLAGPVTQYVLKKFGAK